MKGKTLAICVALALLLTGGWLWLQKTPAEPVTQSGKALLPALQGRTSEVKQIEVIRPGEPPLLLSKNGEDWQLPLPEQANMAYPAATSTVGSLLRALVEAKTVEAKTARPEQHAKLNLAEPGESEGAATRIRLKLKGSSDLVLLLGGARKGDGQLVRLASDNQVWLIDRAISLPADNFLGWINRRITSIAADDIKSIELSFIQAKDSYKTLHMSRDKADEAFNLKEAGDAPTPAVQDAMARLSRIFNALNLSEVKPLNERPANSQALLTFSLSGFNQERLTGQLFQEKEGAYWLTLKSENQVPADWLPAATNWVWQIEDFTGQTLAEALPKALSAKAE